MAGMVGWEVTLARVRARTLARVGGKEGSFRLSPSPFCCCQLSSDFALPPMQNIIIRSGLGFKIRSITEMHSISIQVQLTINSLASISRVHWHCNR